MKKVSKKTILITGGNGVLGSYFYNKYKKNYKIISFTHRLEQFNKLEKWIKNNTFDYFIHFAAVTSRKKENYSKINLINKVLPIKILKFFRKNSIKNFRYFLFISSSHVYGYYKNKILETNQRKPFNEYGDTKKKVEDYILKNRKLFNFKIGIARIFNFTSDKQSLGHFIPDIYQKIKEKKNLVDLNNNRDFIHIDDVARSLELMIKKKFDSPLNICSGVKTNLISLSRKLNLMTFKKNIIFKNSKNKLKQDICGNNTLLKKLGLKKFKNLDIILKSFLYGKKTDTNYR